jgi:hypothetical protein
LLLGSFDLVDLVARNGQVARRATIVSFDRYHKESKDDQRAFHGVVEALQAKWTCEEVPNFAGISYELLEISLGCVGLLKSFLLEASAMQLRNRGKWDRTFLQKAAKSNMLRAKILEEIQRGEDSVRDALCGDCLWDAKALSRLTERMEVANA